MSMHPLTLIIGAPQACTDHALQQVQTKLCLAHGCGTCAVCVQVARGKDHRVFTLAPSKSGYVLDDIELIHEITRFVATEPHAFILPHAELLSESSANSLLKVIEEPPTNYYFFFLTQHPEQLLPTIRSRATAVYISGESTGLIQHPLVRHFLGETISPHDFLKLLERQCPSERETVELVDALYAQLVQTHGNAYVEHTIEAFAQLPMPGGARIFWKNLYLKHEQMRS